MRPVEKIINYDEQPVRCGKPVYRQLLHMLSAAIPTSVGAKLMESFFAAITRSFTASNRNELSSAKLLSEEGRRGDTSEQERFVFLTGPHYAQDKLTKDRGSAIPWKTRMILFWKLGEDWAPWLNPGEKRAHHLNFRADAYFNANGVVIRHTYGKIYVYSNKTRYS